MCAFEGCSYGVNAAGVYCDRHDVIPRQPGWSRTRDEAWLAYKSTEEINAIPLPGVRVRLFKKGTNQEGKKR